MIMVSKSTKLTTDELLELTKYPHIAALATVTPQGEPRVTPCWYEYDGETFNCSSVTNQAKIRYMRENPKVSLIVVYTSIRSQPLIVDGTAELINEGINKSSEFRKRMILRYLGGDLGNLEKAKEYQDLLDSLGMTQIRIWPDKIRYHESGGLGIKPFNVLANIDRLVGY